MRGKKPSIKTLFIILSITSWVLVSGQSVHAQLLEDRNKLKTAKKKTSFIRLKRKVKTSKPRKNSEVNNWKYSGRNATSNPRFSRPTTYGKHTRAGNRKRGFFPSLNRYSKPPKHKPRPSAEYTGMHKTSKTFFAGKFSLNFTGYSKYILRNILKYPNTVQNSYSIKLTRYRGKNQHPSSVYQSSKNNSPVVRNAKRQFNIVWIRMNGNKIQPKAVRYKTKRFKFDKKEKDIWNN